MPLFDQLIREGRDTDAVRLFAKQYYDGGKMGYTRYNLLMRVADALDKATEAARLMPMREHWIDVTVNPSGFTWGRIRDGEKAVFDFGANEPLYALEQIRNWAEKQKEGNE